jgi:hypothetical protein
MLHTASKAITSGNKAQQRRKVAELTGVMRPSGTLKTKLFCNLFAFARSVLT